MPAGIFTVGNLRHPTVRDGSREYPLPAVGNRSGKAARRQSPIVYASAPFRPHPGDLV